MGLLPTPVNESSVLSQQGKALLSAVYQLGAALPAAWPGGIRSQRQSRGVEGVCVCAE